MPHDQAADEAALRDSQHSFTRRRVPDKWGGGRPKGFRDHFPHPRLSCGVCVRIIARIGGTDTRAPTRPRLGLLGESRVIARLVSSRVTVLLGVQQRLRSFGIGEDAPWGGADKTTARPCGITLQMLAAGSGRSLCPLMVAPPANNLEETWNMKNTVELKCWACEKPFNIEYGPGRPPRYCGFSCKNLARTIARRVRFVERREQQRVARAEATSRQNDSAT